MRNGLPHLLPCLSWLKVGRRTSKVDSLHLFTIFGQREATTLATPILPSGLTGRRSLTANSMSLRSSSATRSSETAACLSRLMYQLMYSSLVHLGSGISSSRRVPSDSSSCLKSNIGSSASSLAARALGKLVPVARAGVSPAAAHSGLFSIHGLFFRNNSRSSLLSFMKVFKILVAFFHTTGMAFGMSGSDSTSSTSSRPLTAYSFGGTCTLSKTKAVCPHQGSTRSHDSMPRATLLSSAT